MHTFTRYSVYIQQVYWSIAIVLADIDVYRYIHLYETPKIKLISSIDIF